MKLRLVLPLALALTAPLAVQAQDAPQLPPQVPTDEPLAVPEPGSAALVLLALGAGLGARRSLRRRRDGRRQP
ncbi:MAG: PEP-CTERM sorting domain-containing protein [Rubrivivax sp.]